MEPLEGKVARDSKAVIVSEADGGVVSVTAEQIVITRMGTPEPKKKLVSRPDEGTFIAAQVYATAPVPVLTRSRSFARVNESLPAGQVIADGPPKRVSLHWAGILVAFMPWNGYLRTPF